MAAIETYNKFKIAADGYERFTEITVRLRDKLLLRRSGLRRADLFANKKASEAVIIMVYDNDHSFIKTNALIQEVFTELSDISNVTTEFIGTVSGKASVALGDCPAREHQFAFGMKTAPLRLASVRGTDRIEICSQFQLEAAQLTDYNRLTAELVASAQQQGEGIRRFDWYFDDSTAHGFAIESFVDSASLFSHYENCRELRARLAELASVTTEFLGDLPEPARSALPEFAPHVLSFRTSLISLA